MMLPTCTSGTEKLFILTRMAVSLIDSLVERLALEIHDAAVGMHGPGAHLGHSSVRDTNTARRQNTFEYQLSVRILIRLINRAIVQVIVANLLVGKDDCRRAGLFGNAGDAEFVRGRGTEFLRMHSGERNEGKERKGRTEWQYGVAVRMNDSTSMAANQGGVCSE